MFLVEEYTATRGRRYMEAGSFRLETIGDAGTFPGIESICRGSETYPEAEPRPKDSLEDIVQACMVRSCTDQDIWSVHLGCFGWNGVIGERSLILLIQ